ncbi:MAG: UvrD-helicase domain-containing protein [Deltaproteobacteria bacterium]|nr:UvrD-helicase domain-containing protein [Deltaproteobacteria bacterium]
MEPLDNLNSEQLRAVKHTEGYVRVTAGPGTGKTRTLTARYCYLVANLGVNPMNILCATFTNRAASEMKSRIRAQVGELDLGQISTVHSFCTRILKEEIHRMGFPKNFTIYDTADQKDLLEMIFTDMELSSQEMTIKKAIDEILEARKVDLGYVDKFLLLNNEVIRNEIKKCENFRDEIFLRYLYEQKKAYALDFNDLINFAVYLLNTYHEVRDKWQKRLEYIMIDEFQDMSKKQYDLVALLAGYHHNLFIVGDPDQTIYTWRGSHVELFNKFTERHPNATSISLIRNYRSTPTILDTASNIINNNPDRLAYRPVAQRPTGHKPLFFRAGDVREEAYWLATQIDGLIKNSDLKLSDIAVIYRAHYQSRAIEEALIRKKLPYRLYSGVEFYNRAEIKDMLCYLRMLTWADNTAFLRTIKTPRKKFGPKKLALLAQKAEKAGGINLYQALKDNIEDDNFKTTGVLNYVETIETLKGEIGALSLGDLFQKLMDLTGYEAYLRTLGDQERLDNASELKRAIAAFGQDEEATIYDYLNQAALFTNLDREDHGEATVKLMTVHGAKGLEFPAVLICGLSEGQFPSRFAVTVDEMIEERRLCYVAMTRAKDFLFLTESGNGGHTGLSKETSRFVLEAGPDTISYLTSPQVSVKNIRPEVIESFNVPKHEVGGRVCHPVFGHGVILEVRLTEGAYLVRFEDLETPRSIRFGTLLTLV